jgi:flagellar basal body-associated protein FliL
MNDEIKPKSKKSIVLSIFLLLVLVVLGWLFLVFWQNNTES